MRTMMALLATMTVKTSVPTTARAEQCPPGMGGLCGVVLSPCGSSDMRWSLPPAGATTPNATIQLAAPPSLAGKVLDIGGWDNATGAWMHVWTRTASGWPAINQQWSVEAVQRPADDPASASAVQLVSQMNGLCLGALSGEEGAHVAMANCTRVGTAAPIVEWTVRGGQLMLHVLGSDNQQCVSVEQRLNCTSPQLRSEPFCDASLPAGQRAADLAKRLTVSEMLSVMSPAGGAVPRLGLPMMGHQECQHGVWAAGNTCGSSADDPCPTTFPNLLSLGAAFNRSLVRAMANAIATEVRALHNIQRAGLTCWAPNTNLFRDQRWVSQLLPYLGQGNPACMPAASIFPCFGHGADRALLLLGVNRAAAKRFSPKTPC